MKKQCILWVVFSSFLVLNLSACSSDTKNFTGCWTRPVADNELGIVGFEHLRLKKGDHFHILNELTMNHHDSAFDCSIKFTTSISGEWTNERGILSLTYDASTFKFDTVAGGVKVYAQNAVMPDNIAQSMKSELITAIANYYRSNYEQIQARGSLILEKPIVTGDTLGAWTEGSFIEWTR